MHAYVKKYKVSQPVFPKRCNNLLILPPKLDAVTINLGFIWAYIF